MANSTSTSLGSKRTSLKEFLSTPYFSIEEFINDGIREDEGDGDHSALCCIDDSDTTSAGIYAKEAGIVAGVELAIMVFHHVDEELSITIHKGDGADVKPGDLILECSGHARSLLLAERLVLNLMQRLSGIATTTRRYVQEIEGTGCVLLDTRKTTPGMRYLEKWAVLLGGGANHRKGLYDMIMLKDNHIDYAGGVKQAIERAKNYLQERFLSLKIEVETRNPEEVKEVLEVGGVDRIMLDNFTPAEIKETLKLIPDEVETEASGGITLENIRGYAETGVNFISVGALTHSIKSLDISMKSR